MAHIISYEECASLNHCENCHCPNTFGHFIDCRKCTEHCPCCAGRSEGFCHQCSEENCDNRAAPYDPNSISKKEE